IPLGADALGIVVGDVSDKGVPAAIFMALTSSLLHAEAVRADSPHEALQNVNRLLLDMNDTGMFVTMLYGVLNRTTRELTYVGAGHELPILFDANGERVQLAYGRGQPLGLLAAPLLDEQSVTIPTGGTLLLYTDGVTEAMDVQGAQFGLERLREAMRLQR